MEHWDIQPWLMAHRSAWYRGSPWIICQLCCCCICGINCLSWCCITAMRYLPCWLCSELPAHLTLMYRLRAPAGSADSCSHHLVVPTHQHKLQCTHQWQGHRAGAVHQVCQLHHYCVVCCSGTFVGPCSACCSKFCAMGCSRYSTE